MINRPARRAHLVHVGFSTSTIEHWEKYKPSLFSEIYVDKKLVGLQNRGFEKPLKMIESQPAIMGLSLESIDAKMTWLSEQGFENPQKIVTTFPGILGYSYENIAAKIKGLKERGFRNPVHIITLFPSILSYSFDNIDKKIQGLHALGFEDPVAMINAAPVILGYSIDVIDAKIAWLREQGFENPVSLIVGFPVIISLGYSNLAAKLRYARRMEKFGVDGVKLIEAYPTVLSYNIKRIFFVARLACSFEGIDARIFVRLLRKNPQSLMGAARRAHHPTRKAFSRALAEYETASAKENSTPQGDRKLVLAYHRYKG